MNLPVSELIGYLASVLVVVSLTMREVLRFRLLNLVGGLTFLAYGWLIGSTPVVITNVVIIGINLWFLWTVTTREDYFSLLEVPHSSPYLAEFLEFHHDEIRRFMPEFTGHPGPGSISLLVLRDMVPAGAVIGRPAGEGVLEIDLDYAIPQYRDTLLGRYLFHRRQDTFLDRGFHRLISPAGSLKHRSYLRRVGFVPLGPDRRELSLG
jgi:hypothetical protein